jgi:hypothetical protein
MTLNMTPNMDDPEHQESVSSGHKKIQDLTLEGCDD